MRAASPAAAARRFLRDMKGASITFSRRGRGGEVPLAALALAGPTAQLPPLLCVGSCMLPSVDSNCSPSTKLRGAPCSPPERARRTRRGSHVGGR